MVKRLLLLSLAFPVFAFGQGSSIDSFKAVPGDLDLDIKGYVVRVDTETDSLFLDFGQTSGAKIGQPFIVYKEGDMLTHPVTRKPLGRMEMRIAEGTLGEIHAAYSIGRVGKAFGRPTSGMRAKLVPAPKGSEPPASAVPALRAASAKGLPAPIVPEASATTRVPLWRSPALDYKINAMAVGDFNGDGKLLIALADDRHVRLYAYPPEDAKPLVERPLGGVAPRIISLEAADLNGNGRAELFATSFNRTLNRVESHVLELAPDGAWTKLAEIPWAVRRYQDGEGRDALAVQQLVDDKSFPFSAIFPLAYRDGKYGPGPGRLPHKRVEWLYGFTTADVDGTGEVPLYLTSANHVKIQFKKGYWRSDEAYGQTPIRFTWTDRILECHPAMPASYGAKGFEAVYMVRNIAGFGGLAGHFGHFSSAEIHRKEFNGIGLVTAWKAPLNGYATALALVDPPDGRKLVAALVGTSGKSSVWIYDP